MQEQRTNEAQQTEEHRVNLSGVTDKESLMSVFDQQLELPSFFGKNWDALYDLLNDGDYFAAQTTLILEHHQDFAERCPQLAETLDELLTDVAECWHERGRLLVIRKV